MSAKKSLLVILGFVSSLQFATMAFADENDQVDKDKVSTLNGQLVKVGDKNQYLYDYKRWNISTNPLGIIWGSYGLSASYAFHPNFAVRADVNYREDIADIDSSGLELTAAVPIYFRKMYTDWYIEPGLTYQNLEMLGDDVNTFGPSVAIGHHWYWDSGLNISAALGAGRNWSDAKDKDDANANEDDEDVYEATNKIFGVGYLRFGYAF